MRILSFFFILILTVNYSYAQNYQESLRYSQFQFGSSARTQGVAGAFGAMGADYGGIAINPASLAEYKISDFSFTPSLGFDAATAELANASESIKDSKRFFVDFEQVGLVIAKIPPGKWTTSNWSVGFSKLANYDQNFEFEGTTPGSIIGRFLENTNGLIPDQLDDFESGPAYSTGALFYDDASQSYGTDFEPFATNIFKEQTIKRAGGLSELNIGWAGSYDNKFNIGLSLNFPIVNFTEEKLYQESDPDDQIPVFNAITFSEFLTTSGGGINGKIGLQYKINNRLRFGLAYHSPTVLSLKDEYYTISYYSYNDGTLNEADERSPDGDFDYRITSPGRFMASTGYLFKTSAIAGFINADVELIDYRQNSFNLTVSDQATQADREFQELNNAEIDDNFRQALSYRLGGEIAKGHYRVRGGVALNQSPYKNADKSYTSNLSLGVGYRAESWYVDIAGYTKSTNENYTPFALSVIEEEQQIMVDSRIISAMLTFGFKF